MDQYLSLTLHICLSGLLAYQGTLRMILPGVMSSLSASRENQLVADDVDAGRGACFFFWEGGSGGGGLFIWVTSNLAADRYSREGVVTDDVCFGAFTRCRKYYSATIALWTRRTLMAMSE